MNSDDPLVKINSIVSDNIEQSLRSALTTGEWKKKQGVSQLYQRLTYLQSLSFFRRIEKETSNKIINDECEKPC